MEMLCCLLPLAGALAIVGVAIYAKWYHSNISAKRAAVDFILAMEANAPLTDARRSFARASNKGPQHLKNLLVLVSEDTAQESDWQEYGGVIKYLNHCELVAVSVSTGAIDETIYKKFNQSAYIQAWYRAQEFIEEARTRKNQDTMFEHFEVLAKKWQN